MALRDQPYLPLYVQDFLTDEKLSCCSLSTQGVYIRILCALHKSDNYGGILFKQIPKQNFSTLQFFAFILSKQIGVEIKDVTEAIEELLFFEVLKISDFEENGTPFLYQKRMVKDFNISIKRSESAKKGGGNPKLAKTKNKVNADNLFKQVSKQNPEYEYDNENEYSLIKKESVDFEFFWNDYDKKVGEKDKVKKKWNSLGFDIQNQILDHIPKYKFAQPDKKFRKDPSTYLNNKSWQDEIIESAPASKMAGSVNAYQTANNPYTQ